MKKDFHGYLWNKKTNCIRFCRTADRQHFEFISHFFIKHFELSDSSIPLYLIDDLQKRVELVFGLKHGAVAVIKDRREILYESFADFAVKCREEVHWELSRQFIPELLQWKFGYNLSNDNDRLKDFTTLIQDHSPDSGILLVKFFKDVVTRKCKTPLITNLDITIRPSHITLPFS